MRNDKMIAELEKLAAAFRAKGNQYLEVPKMGRTEFAGCSADDRR